MNFRWSIFGKPSPGCWIRKWVIHMHAKRTSQITRLPAPPSVPSGFCFHLPGTPFLYRFPLPWGPYHSGGFFRESGFDKFIYIFRVFATGQWCLLHHIISHDVDHHFRNLQHILQCMFWWCYPVLSVLEKILQQADWKKEIKKLKGLRFTWPSLSMVDAKQMGRAPRRVAGNTAYQRFLVWKNQVS